MDEDKLLEEAILAELSNIWISPEEIEESEEEDLEEDIHIESDSEVDDLPTSVICYLEQMKQRDGALEKLILQDLEQPKYADNPVQNCPGSELLIELASEFGEDHLNLKEKVLAQIEKEEQRKVTEPEQNTISDFQIKVADLSLEDERVSDNEDDITSKCKEVEEQCWLTLQKWELEENRIQKNKLAELKAHREKEQKQVEEEEERSKSRQQQFEEKLEKLTEERQQQQAELEKKIKQDQEALDKELKRHEALMQSMVEERRIFEEQQEKERKRVKELQYRAATMIQARFRAYLILKEYTPILKEKRDERKRKKDLQLKMAQERRDFEEKIKRKREEQKCIEEEERRKHEENAWLQREEQKQRQIEYEQKKEQARLRLEKERLMEVERLQKLQEEEKKKELQIKEEQREAEERKLLKGKKNEEGMEHMGRKIDLKLIEVNEHFSKKEKLKDSDNSSDAYIPINENMSLPHNILDSSLTNLSKIDRQCTVGSVTDVKVEKELPAEEIVEVKAENTLTIESNITIPQSDVLQVVISCAVADTFPGKLPVDDQSVLNADDGKQQNEAQIDAYTVNENMDLGFEKIFTRGAVLPDHIEQKRLNWMKACNPWSRIFRENERKKVKQQLRLRSNPVSCLPALSPETILHSGVWTSLQQVTTVTLQGLPGCSLSTFSQCPIIKSLTLRNCGLQTLEGINNCKRLKYIDVQENNIKNIHCLELDDLCILLLSHNQITSIHGLEKCSNLRILELSHNNITRIGGLESLKKLQRLVVDHNQLISTKGLSETPTLLYLNCSFNHLSSIEGIDNCGLLQTLKLQNNNLSELPRFGNHVLLRDLHLDDNSISTLKELSDYWLPMLQHLSVSRNSLTRLTNMSDFLLLETFNVGNNRLSDLNSLLLCLNGCHSLLELILDENPFQQESDWRCSILKVLPNLEVVDGDRISSTDEAYARRFNNPSVGSFLALCQTQLQDFELLHRRHKAEMESNSLEIADTHSRHCEELMQLAEECRYAHEYGELSTTQGKKHPTGLDEEEFHVVKQHKKLTINSAEVTGQNSDHIVDSDQVQAPVIDGNRKQSDYPHTSYQDAKDCDPRPLANLEGTAIPLQDFRIKKARINSESIRMTSELQNKESLKGRRPQQHSEANIKNYAATILQSHWRGYIIRRDILEYMVFHNAASVIQNAWRDYCNRKKVAFGYSAGNPPKKLKLFDDSEEGRKRAVVVIQAHWRGCLLRKKLSHALAAVHAEEDDVFAEVNLNEFVFDEATLDEDWTRLDCQISAQTLPLTNSDLQPKALTHYAPDSFALSRQPQLAWQEGDINTVEKYQYPSSVQLCSPRTVSAFSETTSCGKQSFMSEKEEKISLEWGFKDVHTAQLMLKRAQKMKSKKAEARKLQDPVARLALFKNKKNKYIPIKSSKMMHNGVKYFNVPEEPSHQDTTSVKTLQTSRELTYQWLHTQIANREETSSRNKKQHHFLPEMDPEVLNGGRVQLMASPIGREGSDLDLVSVTSGNTISQQSDRFKINRWHSSGSTKATVPPKSGSQPLKQERMSFRDNQMRLSTGWGTGKKRGKPS
ncbi:leucine-rich repeat and IQ domain-containing protein 1 isoform X2 [Amblyraja radiata]|uniref:leucine-rich repeat and IQ domain-containing protein 1 isoform X2 n=1 Tax=Amblyraja radiata TaxID=386614 RepID=UPI001403D092|nr:leucine-rich repeat and IQ domain-containing protein 1 isoform X2 [Amblyraja radiata]